LPSRAVILENDLGRVAHPDHLRLGRRALTLVDDHLTRPIQAGQPTMGWEGDHRLALYVDQRRGEWVLVRLEASGVYGVVATTDPAALALSPVDVVGQLIAHLVAHDVRRGFDPLAAVETHNAARERAADVAFEDQVANDVAPRLRHAFRKDLGAHW
jgi:hypothetical protein